MPSDLGYYNSLAKLEEMANMPIRGVVRQVMPDREAVSVEVFGRPGAATITCSHPFMAVNSWIRGMPEAGTSVMTQMGGEPRQYELFGYISHRLGEQVAKAKEDDRQIFRELNPGEIEIMSCGRAYTHWSEEGDLTHKGGVIEQHLWQTQLEATTLAPTHKRMLDQYDPQVLAKEERFGLVKRPDQQKPYAIQTFIKDGTNFQYEYGRWLFDDGDNLLTSLHEGHLYDIDGNQIKQGKTNRAVRLQRIIGHRQSGELTLDVDEDLNVVLDNQSQAKLSDFNFGSVNEVKIAAQKWNLNIGQSSNQIFSQSLTQQSPKIRINSPDVGFGASPTQQAVLGTNLTSNVLTPLVSMLSGAFNALSVDPTLSPATLVIMSSIAQGIASLANNFSAVLSTQVKLTA